MECLGVSPDVHLGGGFGSRVRVRGHELLGLVDKLVICAAVHLIGTNVDKAPEPTVMPHSVEQPLRGHNIIVRETWGILERLLHVWASCEIHHTVDVVRGEHIREGILVHQVALYEMEVREGFQALNIGERRDYVELIETDNCIFGVSHC